MTSYNLVNGVHASQNGPMIDVVKKDWGFDGVVMSDWKATYDGVGAANAGQDLEMPSAVFMNRAVLLPAIKSGDRVGGDDRRQGPPDPARRRPGSDGSIANRPTSRFPRSIRRAAPSRSKRPARGWCS